MKKKNDTEIVASYDALKEAIRKYDRTLALKLIEHKALTQIPDAEKYKIYGQLLALRDMKIVESISKELDYFQVEMFDLDLGNRLNIEFTNQVITKYLTKFDLENEEARESLFDFSCQIGNVKAASAILKKDPTQKKYIKLASSSVYTFDLLLRQKITDMDVDTIVQILYHAAITQNSQERLSKLVNAGYDINTKDAKNKTVKDLLTARINGNSYPSNKRGVQMKQSDKNTLQAMNHVTDEIETVQKQKKLRCIGVITIVIVLAASIAFAFWYTNRDTSSSATEDTTDTSSSDSTTSDSSSSDSASTSLSTDTSLTVADGDTVNIDYTGYVDDVAFDGGSTDGAGADLTIGSGSYIDDFEDQLIGHNVGDSVDVNVTFPDDYSSTDLAGKDAKFEVTINGIYE